MPSTMGSLRDLCVLCGSFVFSVTSVSSVVQKTPLKLYDARKKAPHVASTSACVIADAVMRCVRA